MENEAIVLKTCKTFLQHCNKGNKGGSSLFSAFRPIRIDFILNRVPLISPLRPRILKVPHKPFGEPLDVCLIVKDEDKKRIKEMQLEGIKKVIPLRKLRDNYKVYEDRRILVASYDLFLADDRIIPALPRVTGKPFYHRHKVPIAIRVGTKETTQKNVDTVLTSSYMWVPKGVRGSIQVGTTQMDAQKLGENVLAVMNQLLTSSDKLFIKERPPKPLTEEELKAKAAKKSAAKKGKVKSEEEKIKNEEGEEGEEEEEEKSVGKAQEVKSEPKEMKEEEREMGKEERENEKEQILHVNVKAMYLMSVDAPAVPIYYGEEEAHEIIEENESESESDEGEEEEDDEEEEEKEEEEEGKKKEKRNKKESEKKEEAKAPKKGTNKKEKMMKEKALNKKSELSQQNTQGKSNEKKGMQEEKDLFKKTKTPLVANKHKVKRTKAEDDQN
ncbi:putative structural constituent of ribosome [Monocercomonoides exilis]|uniref:putative structural constituent of ribosome n=1 Tax=Monocercomonoides exilis TaxID=2049356 RepID=UPI0035598193|nr:putative structural constituent of ribosome [Monocercomonoides exilis]|eukprot:MONOS_7938.1-p1 / transcript=MONOS_7938.1 / gene=MONOS_7938 / organism=Monocercomonoides_exilis_PA203 / gene_product=structural constituent of ribosome / transcript_product=structural constituent of ribosome / location=Mono_scaffold00286:14917-16482(-) / protein_length=441 / sequence_SO=supercontig / SO=protein_coding / is_pseudo=false